MSFNLDPSFFDSADATQPQAAQPPAHCDDHINGAGHRCLLTHIAQHTRQRPPFGPSSGNQQRRTSSNGGVVR